MFPISAETFYKIQQQLHSSNMQPENASLLQLPGLLNA